MLSTNRSILFIVALTPVLMASECGIPDYGTAHTANEHTYLTKPVYTDTSTNAIYVSGRFSHTASPYYEQEHNYFGEINLHRSHTWENINLAYGIFGYGGSYRIHQVELYQGKKYYGGFGATGELNFNIPFKRVDWRVIGFRTTMFYENGEYASFREMAERDTLIENVNHNHGGVNVSASFEVVAKLRKVNFGLYGAIGTTLGLKDVPISRDTSVSPATTTYETRNSFTSIWVLHLAHKQMSYFMQCSTGDYHGVSVSGGITYRIKYKTAALRRARKSGN